MYTSEKNMQAIVLAAGKSSRFRTGKTKLLEKLCGRELVIYCTQLLSECGIPTVMVVGYQKEAVQEMVTQHHGDAVRFVVQEQQLGTGHAILCSQPTWNKDHILIMNGDVPLVTQAVIEELYQEHIKADAAISFVTAYNADPSVTGYGRVMTIDNHIKIVEAKDFDGDAQEHCCFNAGIYLVKRSFLEASISELDKNNKSKEFYFTDMVSIASQKGLPVVTVDASFNMVRGINTFQELWAVEQIKRAELIKYWMDQGVNFPVAQNVHIDLNVTIGSGSSIGGGVYLLNGTVIGKNCKIHELVSLDNVRIGDNSHIFSHCIIKDSSIGSNALIGPFAHVRGNTVIGDDSAIGNFVEVKNSTLGVNTRVKHLSYLGDAIIGNNVNIGAGTITCNYNGVTKNETTIEDDVFIGSNTILVAPVTVGERAFTAAGSIITENVPADAVAFARARQINKEGYAATLRERFQNKNDKAVPCTCPHESEDEQPATLYAGAVRSHDASSI